MSIIEVNISWFPGEKDNIDKNISSRPIIGIPVFAEMSNVKIRGSVPDPYITSTIQIEPKNKLEFKTGCQIGLSLAVRNKIFIESAWIILYGHDGEFESYDYHIHFGLYLITTKQ